MNIDPLMLVPSLALLLALAFLLGLICYWASARQERINRQRALRTQRENDAEALNKFGHGFGDWAVRQPRPQARDHDLERVPGYEDLWHCTACSCAEGTLPTQCPRVKVPPRVQDLIIKGVVDFVDGRWVGVRKPFSITIRLGPAVEDMAQAFRNLADAFRQSAASIRELCRATRTSRDTALRRLMFITGQDRIQCNDPRVIRYGQS